jgi:hypothetical protein
MGGIEPGNCQLAVSAKGGGELPGRDANSQRIGWKTMPDSAKTPAVIRKRAGMPAN